MSASGPARVGSFPHRVRVAEAAAALVVARLLIASTPWRIWRWTLGSPLRGAANPAGPEAAELAPEIEVVRRAVDRAGRRLPLRFVCLPRAMAMHWRKHAVARERPSRARLPSVGCNSVLVVF